MSGNRTYNSTGSQKGVALVIALVLLIAVTLLGLAGIRGTTLQEKMAANFYDRDVAVQAAEAALRVGAATMLDTTAVQWRDCSQDVQVCDPTDVLTQTNPGDWYDVDSNVVPSSARYAPGSFGAGTPEFVVEYMGLWPDFSAPTNVGTGGDIGYETQNTGDGGQAASIRYYRITARSSSPDEAGDRAIVVLQGWFRG